MIWSLCASCGKRRLLGRECRTCREEREERDLVDDLTNAYRPRVTLVTPPSPAWFVHPPLFASRWGSA